MTSIEILAFILIIAAAIKLLVLAFNPSSWMNFAKKIWAKPVITQIVCLLLAILVFYYLIDSGLTIVQILAVTLFVALFMAVALAPEVEDLIRKYQSRIKRGSLWKQYWIYIVLWIILLLWGLKEIFM